MRSLLTLHALAYVGATQVREMQAQLKFYEARVADMHREHKAVLQRLLPGASAGAEEGSAAGAAPEQSAEQLRQRCALLEAQVAVLQSEAEEKSEALEGKRRQQNEVRACGDWAQGMRSSA